MKIALLIVFGGTANRIEATILKDDGCNTNVISRDFYHKYATAFNAETIEGVKIQHSSRSSSENANTVLKNVNIAICNHRYISDFLVADSRYDIILGTLWHIERSP